MLPNIENIDTLISYIEKVEELEKTKTFQLNSELSEILVMTGCILGECKLGGCMLGTNKTATTLKQMITGTIDGLEALRQSIYFMLNTERDKFIIYPYTYGLNTLDLIGKPSYYVIAVLPGRITETLLSDDRITGVSDFEFNIDANKITVKFVIHSIYGDIEEETAVVY